MLPSNFLETIKNGENEVDKFEYLFDCFYLPLCRFAAGYVNSNDVAEEVVQGLFVKIWDNRNSIQINISIKSYLYQATRNSCLNVIKHANIRSTYIGQYLAESNSSPFYNAEYQREFELEEKIKNAIDSLPNKTKEIFKMSRNEGLRNQQIADKLDLSIKSIEFHIGKSLRLLRVELKDFLT